MWVKVPLSAACVQPDAVMLPEATERPSPDNTTVPARVQPPPVPANAPGPSGPVPAASADGPPKPKKGVLIGALALLLVVFGIGGYVAATSGDGGDTAGSTTLASGSPSGGTSASTETSTATTPTTLPPTCQSSGGRCVFIDGVTLDGTSLVVSYSTFGYEPLINGSGTDHHIHFFFDTVPLAETGVPGAGPWVVWDLDENGDKLFHGEKGFKTTDIPDGAQQVCAVVATIDHRLDDDPKPSCVDLP